MSPHHHIDEDILWDYCRGALTPGLDLVVAAHLEVCADCRSEMRLLDAVGGALLENIEGVDMSETALDLALARIERPEDARSTPRLPAFLAGLDLPDSLKTADIEPRYWAAPGVWIAPVRMPGTPRGAKTFLLHVKAGMAMPEHTHRGVEATLVLKGRFRDKFGEYAAGDITICNQEHCHSPTILDEDCLCLTWQAGDIVPMTWLGRVLQPFARI